MKEHGKMPATTAYVDKLLGFRGFASLCEFSFLRKRIQKKKKGRGKEEVVVSYDNTLT
jgi:hypothetical protein